MRAPIAFVILALIAAGCNKSGGSSPTAPTPITTPTPPPVTAPTISQAARIDTARVSGLDYAVALNWDAVPGATSYLVESGQAGQIESVEVEGTSYEFKRTGSSCVGVRSKNSAGVSPAAPCRPVTVLDMRDVIEALFFNSGAYAETETVDPHELMWGWPLGAIVPVLVGSNVPGVQHAAMSRVAEQFSRVTGVVSFPVVPSTVVETAIWETNRIRAIQPSAEQRSILCANVGDRSLEGCARPSWRFTGTYTSGVAVLWANTPWLAAHELAHLFGVFHVRMPSGSFPPSGTVTGLMQSPRPSPEPNEFAPYELEAIRLAYSNGFHNGTIRQDFITRGLIRQR